MGADAFSGAGLGEQAVSPTRTQAAHHGLSQCGDTAEDEQLRPMQEEIDEDKDEEEQEEAEQVRLRKAPRGPTKRER